MSGGQKPAELGSRPCMAAPHPPHLCWVPLCGCRMFAPRSSNPAAPPDPHRKEREKHPDRLHATRRRPVTVTAAALIAETPNSSFRRSARQQLIPLFSITAFSLAPLWASSVTSEYTMAPSDRVARIVGHVQPEPAAAK